MKLNFKASNNNYILYEGIKIDFDIDKFIENYVRENYGGDLLLDSKV